VYPQNREYSHIDQSRAMTYISASDAFGVGTDVCCKTRGFDNSSELAGHAAPMCNRLLFVFDLCRVQRW